MLLWLECLAAIQGFSVSCFFWEEELIESCRVFVQSDLFARNVSQVSLLHKITKKYKQAGGGFLAEKSKCARSFLPDFFKIQYFASLAFFWPSLSQPSASRVVVGPTEILSSCVA